MRNLKRVIEIWGDGEEKWKDKFYGNRPWLRDWQIPDYSDRLALRQEKSCKSMDWYVNNVYPEMKGSATSVDEQRRARKKR